MLESIKDLNNLTKTLYYSVDEGNELCVTYQHRDFHTIQEILREINNAECRVERILFWSDIGQIGISYIDELLLIGGYFKPYLASGDMVYESSDIVNECKELVTAIKLLN